MRARMTPARRLMFAGFRRIGLGRMAASLVAPSRVSAAGRSVEMREESRDMLLHLNRGCERMNPPQQHN